VKLAVPREPLFDRVAIVGMGLLGGSLGMALRRGGLARQVVGVVRRSEAVELARRLGAADQATVDVVAGVAGAELVILAAPILSIPLLVERMADSLAAGAIVTDVGSTKLELERRLPSLLPPGAAYVGGHPMAGSERSGLAAARPDLFRGATYVLTLPPGGRREALNRLSALAGALGAEPLEMRAAEHDEVVARISHLPHLVAAALAAAARAGEPDLALLQALAAGGFRDTTRVAASPAEMWRDVCLTNAGPVLAGLRDCEALLGRFRRALEHADGAALCELFERGARARSEVLHRQPSTAPESGEHAP
jgi:prephenate dehydrogenase